MVRLRSSRMLATLVTAGMAIAVGLLGVVPVRSQTLEVEALYVTQPVSVLDPWDEIWTRVRSQEVPLSAQNIVPPFGGGTVRSVEVRALHDGARLYLLLEWPDATVNDGVAGSRDFSDAAAVQFPLVDGAGTPYTMGGVGTPVNIWQWKAVWQADLSQGFGGTISKYPDTYVDYYPNADDPIYRPAEQTGNPVAQRAHASPIENLVAEGFGTLTSSETQDVDGAGAWKLRSWRALFVRDLVPSDQNSAGFTVGGSTMVAFAIWDGQQRDRDGQKSIAQFVDLSLSREALPAVAPPSRGGAGSLWILVGALVITAAFALRLATLGQPGPGVRVEEGATRE